MHWLTVFKSGYQFNRNDIDILYEKFLKVADLKREIQEEDLNALVHAYKPEMEMLNG